MAELDLDDVEAISRALLDRGHGLGIFDSVTGHEPKSSPGRGLHLAMWNAGMAPIQDSGLASASVRIEFQLRVMGSMIQTPMDGIDPEVVGAAGMVMNALAGGYTLAGQARAVDVLGAYGEGLRMQTGYLSIGGGQGDGAGTRMYRVADVFVPIVLNDCWVYGE